MFSEEEEIKLNAMQRSWHHSRRSSSAFSLFEEDDFVEKPILARSGESSSQNDKFAKLPSSFVSSDIESDPEDEVEVLPTKTVLDASDLGDIPARYVIQSLEAHQFPVVGVYTDKRVIPGFKYRVIPLASEHSKRKEKYLFNGKGLTLKNIGRGYARRFTFATSQLYENYFYSDNRPEGFAFELEAVSVGDKFTIFDVNHEEQGKLEVINVDHKQLEVSTSKISSGIEKRIKVKVTANVELYDGVSQKTSLSGLVISLKRRDNPIAEITKIINVHIKHHRYYLTPGYQSCRRVKVDGNEIGDVPAKYTITGLEPYEIPVIGTYVDPRILPGFTYRIRPTHSKKYLFNGKPLKLNSIGMGYAKRFTFESDSKLNNENFFWSDSHPDGLAFETRAVYQNMRFTIMANGQNLGEATVFRSDLPQAEEYTKVVFQGDKKVYLKYVHVDVLCHIRLDIKNSGSVDENLMRVYGLAVLRKDANGRDAVLERVENVAFDSQLNLIFARVKAGITFVPLS